MRTRHSQQLQRTATGRQDQSAHANQAVPEVPADLGGQPVLADPAATDPEDPRVLQVRAALQRLGVQAGQVDRLAQAALQPHADLAVPVAPALPASP